MNRFPLTLLIAIPVLAQPSTPALRSYSYISDKAKAILGNSGVTEKSLIEFTDRELKARKIDAIDPNRVFEDSEDSLRVDIRKEANALVIELSVRQGVSVHNMLERWKKAERLAIKASPSPRVSRQEILALISAELDDLKANFNTPHYKQGKMMEE